jgi:uncharacterized membrane protein
LLWRPDAAELLAVGWAGFLAAYVDSLLGATVQAHYRCVRCELTIDRNEHCGVPAERLRGIKWFTNDAVNLAASVSGILFAWIFLRYYAYPL